MNTKILALFFAVMLVLGLFSGCGGSTATNDAGLATTPEVTQPGDEGKYLKVLTIGHSLAVDCGHMLALVAAAEGYEGLTVGTLYYSGCPLNRHVQYLTNDTPDYRLYLSSTDKSNAIPATTQNVTMQYALELDYWDIVVMQAGVFEVAESNTYTCGDIQTIQNYVREHVLNSNVKFAWHMPWVFPTDNDLRDLYDGSSTSNPYYEGYVAYGDDRTTLYNAMTKCVTDHIMTDSSFDFMIPTGTAMENALSSYWEEKQLHRDYAHATDVARVMSSYVWYCKLVGIDKLEKINLDVIPKNFFVSLNDAQDYVLTDMDKAIILESVNNALASPLKMTQSQHTVAP